MYYFILLIPLPLLIIIAFYLNRKKLYKRSGNFYLVTFLEGLGSYLVIVALLLEGFIVNPVLKVVILLVGLFLIAYSMNNINENNPEWELQLETMKNSIVIFSSTVLLFFITLTIFRFQAFYLQVLFSLLIVVIFNIISIYLKRWVEKTWDKLSYNLSMFVSFTSWYLYAAIVLIFMLIIVFNFPRVAVNQSLNLGNSNAYFGVIDGSTDLVNRYESELLIDLDVEMRMDNGAYINRKDEYVFIFIRDELLVYDLKKDELTYSGAYQSNINGMEIDSINQEVNEIKYQTYCGEDDLQCLEYIYPFEYGDVEYKYKNQILKIENLSYNHSDTAIFTDDIIHLFSHEEIDSRVDLSKDRPFIGFNDSNALVSDIDFYDGGISYLQLEIDEELLNIKVYDVLERKVDLVLPFYSHYRFGILVFVFIMAFIPISNYDRYRHEFH